MSRNASVSIMIFLAALGFPFTAPTNAQGGIVRISTVAGLKGEPCGGGAAEYRGTYEVSITTVPEAWYGGLVVLNGKSVLCGDSGVIGSFASCKAQGVMGAPLFVTRCTTTFSWPCNGDKTFKARAFSTTSTNTEVLSNEGASGCVGFESCPM